MLECNAPVEVEPKNDIGLFINRSLSDIEKNIVSAFFTHYFWIFYLCKLKKLKTYVAYVSKLSYLM